MTLLADDGGVLVPSGINPATYQCIRSLGWRGVRTIGVSTGKATPAFVSKYCAEVAEAPSPLVDFEGYRDAMLALAARDDVRSIVPCREEDAFLLSKYREEFAERVSLVVPTMDGLREVQDRVRLFEAAEAAGVPYPKTRLLVDVDDFSDRLIVKSRYNLLTRDYVPDRVAADPEEVKTVVHLAPDEEPDREALREEFKHTPIVQEFVEKEGEYMFAALYDHGEPVTTYHHRQIRGDSYTGGGGVYRESIFDENLEAVGRRLLDELDWHGLACVEYIKDARTGEFKPVEHNPRMWQSLPSTVRAGADFPLDYWLVATDRADRVDAGYRGGVGCHALDGELGYLLSLFNDDSPHVERPSVPGTLVEMGLSFLAQPHMDYVHLDDMRPFFHGFRHAVGSAAAPDDESSGPVDERSPASPDAQRPTPADESQSGEVDGAWLRTGRWLGSLFKPR